MIGLEEACPTIRGPGPTIWSATWQTACRRCNGADKASLGVWQSTQGLCRGSFHHSSMRSPHLHLVISGHVLMILIQVCRWSLCCVGSARLYGLPVLHHIQASWNRRKINIYQSFTDFKAHSDSKNWLLITSFLNNSGNGKRSLEDDTETVMVALVKYHQVPSTKYQYQPKWKPALSTISTQGE